MVSIQEPEKRIGKSAEEEFFHVFALSVIFRGVEYPNNFQFKSGLEDEQVDIPELAIVGVALASGPQFNNDILVWESGSATRMSKQSYKKRLARK
jgi:hypothetical protein